jgi:AcrR family transcriptional regulator
MGRPPSFDRDTVVRAARSLFWKHGFEDASVPELEEVTGLGRSSIYHAFGSKRGLFDAAIQSYLNEVVRPRLRPLLAPHVATTALTDYLDGLRDAFVRADSMPGANGCLLVNSAGAPISDDADVARTIADYHEELRAAVLRGVEAQAGDASAAQRARLADTVTGLVVAAFALVRVAPGQAIHTLATARALDTPP